VPYRFAARARAAVDQRAHAKAVLADARLADASEHIARHHLPLPAATMGSGAVTGTSSVARHPRWVGGGTLGRNRTLPLPC